MPVIDIKNLTKTYKVYQKREGWTAPFRDLFARQFRTVEAVRDVSFVIERGEMVAFLGPNGAGKTTTLKLLAGLIFPNSGTAQVLGYVPWKRENAYRRRFALVMGQKNQLWWDLPARDSFRLHKEIYRIEPAEFDRRMDELTDWLQVKHLVAQPVRELSLGERMRMELIAALLHQPEVLLLDEPTIGLDVVSQKRVQDFLKEYQTTRQITVLLTSHYMKDVEALCKRTIIINEGLVKHDGPLADIVDRFSSDKILELQFADAEIPPNLSEFGDVFEVSPPKAKLRVPRNRVPEILSRVLAAYQTVEDVSVQERPLEEIIANMFTTTGSNRPGGNGG
ncbi:MAG: ABC transporter ATP-binding protein [Planctomycetales bacterium]